MTAPVPCSLFRCCRHCVGPCPASGHTLPCAATASREDQTVQCVGNKGWISHFPFGTVRTWPIRRSGKINANELNAVADQADRLQAAARFAP